MKKNIKGLIIVLIVIAAVIGIIGYNVVNKRIILSKVGSEFNEATYRKIMIGGDMYEYPFTVKELYDNGWEVEDYVSAIAVYAGAPSSVDAQNTAENITLVRKNRKLRIEVYNPSNRTVSLEKCLVSRLSFPDLERPKVVLPGNYKLGGPFPIENYEKFLSSEYSDSDSAYEKYVIPFAGTDGHICQLTLTYDINSGRTTFIEYAMIDLIINIDTIVSDLDWNLENMFYNGEKEFDMKEAFSQTGMMNNLVETLNNSRIVDSIIYVSGFDDEVVKDTNGDMATFINNVEDTVEWKVYKVDEFTVGVKYSYPNSLEIMSEALDDVLSGYTGDDSSKDQDLFETYAKKLSNVKNFEMSEGELEVEVVNGEITSDNYSLIYMKLFGLGELFE
ncbi:MAG: hypothetical protein K5988_06280 [Lachnospiraceae bacterium]|nr:hypothetical protein [Lachnospiraceae bacterium]